MATPRISVLMTAYNAEKYIAEAIESILNQTYRDFEFIIINAHYFHRTLVCVDNGVFIDKFMQTVVK